MKWTPRRKLAIMNQIATAPMEQRITIMSEHNLTTDELNQWLHAFAIDGLDGLKATRQYGRDVWPRGFVNVA